MTFGVLDFTSSTNLYAYLYLFHCFLGKSCKEYDCTLSNALVVGGDDVISNGSFG